jgi:DNA-binding IclR family transcriptional regulator
LFSSFAALENAFGLSQLGAVERAVFQFIAERFAAGEPVVALNLLASGLGPRSNIYRHLDTLERRGLIVLDLHSPGFDVAARVV